MIQAYFGVHGILLIGALGHWFSDEVTQILLVFVVIENAALDAYALAWAVAGFLGWWDEPS